MEEDIKYTLLLTGDDEDAGDDSEEENGDDAPSDTESD